jgi:hypothetical protein
MIAAGSAPAGRALDAALLDAHARGDVTALIGLYARAADRAEQAGAAEPAAFFRTQAWVFALEAGDARAPCLHAALARAGRAD